MRKQVNRPGSLIRGRLTKAKQLRARQFMARMWVRYATCARADAACQRARLTRVSAALMDLLEMEQDLPPELRAKVDAALSLAEVYTLPNLDHLLHQGETK